MRDKLAYPLIVGMCLMALGASGKAFIDIAVHGNELMNLKQMILLIHEDVKDIKTHLIKE